MASNFPSQTPAYGQFPQYGFGQQPQMPPTFSGGQMPGFPSFPQPQKPQSPAANVPGMLPIEESYIENILRLNKGKIVTVYTTFENNSQWNAKIFKGAIEAAGRDHLIISDPQTGQRYLIPMIYVDFVTFDEEIEYQYPFSGMGPSLSSFPPR
ncbi:spore coat protein GerQ [Schinkia azotoformans]|uniref:spore coat protein GerQ n=1 Tax=Schinkia azotoformans TaxID=1454 RepID=UPI002DBA798C|nr:spore coat protein GerQ [Schinkia azotoformans]MEC1719484.1 spore coat protein GerQ [Schinkia azotoformans]MED4351226.1 spore coat protein GerQ [Schinkia azotoformans]MED4413784.1 spore coat protein GerQ [Schinkia azotoformans]